jgi:uncharacterized protein
MNFVPTMFSTAHQKTLSEFLAARCAERNHLVISISGAHAYGFPSPDSDVDVKAIHIAPTRTLLGLTLDTPPADKIEIIDGLELDYSSNELSPVLRSCLSGNGNYLERILGHLQPMKSPLIDSLRPLVKGIVSRKVFRHYQGFARQQLGAWEDSNFTSAKKLLYVVRTTLSGRHALFTGEIETDVNVLCPQYGVNGYQDLIAVKLQGEHAKLGPSLSEHWKSRIGGLFEELSGANEKSILPIEADEHSVKALEKWLIDVRLNESKQ